MKRAAPSQPRAWRTAVLVVAVFAIAGAAAAEGLKTAPSGVTASSNNDGPSWKSLRPGQRDGLAPLERNWPGMTAASKQRWLAVVGRFPTIDPAERSRIQGQMTDWAKLSPAERGQVRLRFQEAKQVPAKDRRQRWEDYQALRPEQKQQFEARAQRAASSVDARGSVSSLTRAARGPNDVSHVKSNLVPNPALSAKPKWVAPTLVQARPGATTTYINKAPTPPSHQQIGMPKIAATPEFIDKSTLLPKRGAQAAGVSAVAPEAATMPR